MKIVRPEQVMGLYSHKWLLGFFLAVAICILLVISDRQYSELSAGGGWRLGYGAAASLLLLAAMLYPVRRRAPGRGPGAARHWLQMHLYGGTLFLVLVFMHSGFGLPVGALDWGLWLLSIWTVASGLLGVVIQRWIPRILTSGLTTEVHYDRIGELVDTLRDRSVQLIATSDAAIQDFFDHELAPQMEAPQCRLIYFLDITGGIQSQVRRFQYLARFLPEAEATRLEELKTLFVTKLELDAHYTLQGALRWWLYGHVPFSLLLVGLLGVHIFLAVYY